MAAKPHFEAIRDTREQKGQGWFFHPSGPCLGTTVATLKTGDYSIAGFEDRFTIERKRSTAELATNLFESRFQRELKRMDAMESPYLFLEFELEDVVSFPLHSGIPEEKWEDLNMTPKLFMKLLHEIQLDFPRVRVWFVGDRGREAAFSLFKRIAERE